MTPAEHRAEAEQLVAHAEKLRKDRAFNQHAMWTADALVHALLALSPAATPPPSRKPKPAQRVEVFDVELNAITVTNWSDGVALIHPAYEWSTLLDNPAQVRLLADTLTAHADHMENR